MEPFQLYGKMYLNAWLGFNVWKDEKRSFDVKVSLIIYGSSYNKRNYQPKLNTVEYTWQNWIWSWDGTSKVKDFFRILASTFRKGTSRQENMPSWICVTKVLLNYVQLSMCNDTVRQLLAHYCFLFSIEVVELAGMKSNFSTEDKVSFN